MSNSKEKIMQVMKDAAQRRKNANADEWPLVMPTWHIRLALEKKFPDETWKCEEIRKVLTELASEGLVTKDTVYSRIGQAAWRLEVKV